MTSPKKPGVALWATATLIVVLLYVASYGPYIWLIEREWLPGWAVEAAEVLYYPIRWIFEFAPLPLLDGLEWYLDFWWS